MLFLGRRPSHVCPAAQTPSQPCHAARLLLLVTSCALSSIRLYADFLDEETEGHRK